MAIEISVPDIGADELEVTEILVKIGDTVRVEQPLITVEGDKVSMEVPSPQAGIVKKLYISVGDKVTTGKLIMVFEREKNEIIEELSNVGRNPLRQEHHCITANLSFMSKESGSCKTILMPNIGDDQMQVTAVLVRLNDNVKSGKPLITVENNKKSIEISTPCSGVARKISVKIGDQVTTGSQIMVLDVNEEPMQYFSSNNKEAFVASKGYLYASPLIRRLAREHGVNLEEIQGTGRKGRILREDVLAYLTQKTSNLEYSDSAITQNSLFHTETNSEKLDPSGEMTLTRIQRVSGTKLHKSWTSIPHVTQFEEIDITELEQFRKEFNSKSEKGSNEKITLLAFIIKVIARTLEDFPRFNSVLSQDAKKLILNKHVNIGIAVATEDGLVVPVILNVNRKGVRELSRELVKLAKAARSGKLTSCNMQGGCFTVSNLGGIGGTAFTPIINYPEVAILGISRSSIKPIWDKTTFIPRTILPVSLSYDHRVIDGVDGANFIKKFNTMMTDIRFLVM